MDILRKEKGVSQLMYCRGIRGATTVEHNDREEILAATTELLQLLIRRNDLHAEDVASAIFTVTEDLDAEFPALAARYLGWTEVALMCTREIPVPGSLEKCIRILLHVNKRAVRLKYSMFIPVGLSICVPRLTKSANRSFKE